MKLHEKVVCKVNHEALQEDEKPYFREKWLKADTDDLTVEAEVFQMTKIDDVFNDGSALKYLIKGGSDYQKPEKVSVLRFDIEISVAGKMLYTSTPPTDVPEDVTKGINTKAWEMHLDEYKMSKMVKHCLMRMKKNEIARLVCNDKTLIQLGRDHDVIVKHLGAVPDVVEYVVRLYSFTEGKNTFNMTIDEKIEQAQRKKQVGVMLIK
jgi:FK506-binding protein 4/5